MSRRKIWTRKNRVLCATFTTIILGTSAWAAISGKISAVSSADSVVEAPIPPPQSVYVQQRENSDGLGNARVLIQLTPEQLAEKRQDGTADFLTLGDPAGMALLRDDGVGGDDKAGDGLYTGFATVDPKDLERRASEDQAAHDSQATPLIPLFQGRAAVDVVEPVPFDYAGFAAGRIVRLDPAVSFLEPETETEPSDGVITGAATAGGPRLMTSRISSPAPVALGINNFQSHSLMITNTSVVTDPTRTWDPCNNAGNANGVWTFNHLMTQMANTPSSGIPAPDFVNTWLQNWLNPNLVINQDPVPARAAMASILSQWPKLANGKLDLTKSPLRLLAIDPRLDLRKTTGGGGGYSPSSGNFLDAGEARFIFGFVAKKTATFNPATAFTGAAQINTSTCFALPFTVIFEYRIPKSACLDVRSWARGWKQLSQLPFGQPYNTQLQNLTQQFVMANANPAKPNGSALGQLRTNDVALGAPWELRQFQLTQMPFSFLTETTVEDTIRNDPGSDYNNNTNGPALLSYILNVVKPLLVAGGNEASIPLIPLFYQGNSFLAGDARVNEANPALITFHWTAPGGNYATDLKANWARHRVSRASCNGCHRRETFTPFVHVNPSNIGGSPALPAELSVFLTGINGLGDPATSTNVSNPSIGTPKRNFDDLARRELDLNSVAGMSCSGMPFINVGQVHASLQETGRLPANLFEGQSLDTLLSVSIDDMMRNPVFEVH